MNPTAPEICRVIANVRADVTCEKRTQADIETALVAAFGDLVKREHRLAPGDIPDFMIGGVVVEVKIKGAVKRSVYRQLERYGKHDCVTAIVLASSLAMGLPAFISDTPAYFVSLGRGWL